MSDLTSRCVGDLFVEKLYIYSKRLAERPADSLQKLQTRAVRIITFRNYGTRSAQLLIALK